MCSHRTNYSACVCLSVDGTMLLQHRHSQNQVRFRELGSQPSRAGLFVTVDDDKSKFVESLLSEIAQHKLRHKLRTEKMKTEYDEKRKRQKETRANARKRQKLAKQQERNKSKDEQTEDSKDDKPEDVKDKPSTDDGKMADDETLAKSNGKGTSKAAKGKGKAKAKAKAKGKGKGGRAKGGRKPSDAMQDDDTVPADATNAGATSS